MRTNGTHPETALVPAGRTAPAILLPSGAQLRQIDPQRYEILVKQIANGLSPLQIDFFITRCNALGLDPFAGEIYAWIGQGKVVIHPSISGLANIAHRNDLFDGFEGPFWTADGVNWTELWIDPTIPPAGAKCRVYRKGCSRPFPGVRSFEECVKRDSSGRPVGQWATSPAHMIAVRALYAALKIAFPGYFSGEDDLDSYDGTVVEEQPTPLPANPAYAVPSLAAPSPQAPASATVLQASPVERQPQPEPPQSMNPEPAGRSRGDMVARCINWYEGLPLDRKVIAAEEWHRRFPGIEVYDNLTEEQLVAWGRVLKRMVEEPGYDPRPITQPMQAQAAAPAAADAPDAVSCQACGGAVSGAQKTLSERKYGVALCPTCQKERRAASDAEATATAQAPAQQPQAQAEPVSAAPVKGKCENCGGEAPEGTTMCRRCDPFDDQYDEVHAMQPRRAKVAA